MPITRKLRISDNCLVQTSNWTECSRVCDWGLSERVTNDNKRCSLTREIRLCQQRPCEDSNLLTEANSGQLIRIMRSDRSDPRNKKPSEKPAIADQLHGKCQRTKRSARRVRFQFDGCTSTKLYKPRYCGDCSDSRCCRPSKVRTITVNFKCEDGHAKGRNFQYKMMMIRTCKCERDCTTNEQDYSFGARGFLNTGLHMGIDTVKNLITEINDKED